MKSRKQLRRPRNKSKKFREMNGGGDLEDQLFKAILNNNVEIVKDMIEQGADVNAIITQTQETPLYIACTHGKREIILALLYNGAKANAKCYNNDTPLHEVCRYGYTEIIEDLLHYDADINAKNNQGNTPLHIASLYCRIETIIKLLDMGADVNASNIEGHMPSKMCNSANQEIIQTYLRDRERRTIALIDNRLNGKGNEFFNSDGTKSKKYIKMPPTEIFRKIGSYIGGKSKSRKQLRRPRNKSKKFRVKLMKGGGGQLSRPSMEREIPPQAEVVKQLKFEFFYTTPFRDEISSFRDNTLKDLHDYKTPQLGDNRGKGEYIIDLVYDQEDEGINEYRDAKSRIKDLIDNQQDKYGKLHRKLRSAERSQQSKRAKLNEGQSVQPFTLYIEISRLQEEIDKIDKELYVTEERLIHLDAIQNYLMTYHNTDVHYPLIEGRISNLGTRLFSDDDSHLPVATRLGGKKWSNKYKAKINCKNPKGFSQKQYCKYGRKK